ncbi:MAG: MMPL family transporter [Gemmatimonadota bacterium]
MLDRMLRVLARVAADRPGALLGAALLVTLLAGWQMSHLELRMQLKDLMPQDHPMVRELNRIVEDYASASQIIVAAGGPEAGLRAFADELAPRLTALDQDVRRVDYRLERGFFQRHGLMLVKARDLGRQQGLFAGRSLASWLAGLNDSFEQTWVDDEASLSSADRERGAIAFLDGVDFWVAAARRFAADPAAPDSLGPQAADRLLLGDEYFISPGKDLLLLFAQPTFSLNEIDRVVAAEDTIDAIVARVAAAHPGVTAGTTGTMALARDEMVAATEDAYATSLIAFVLIIALFIVSFRLWVAPLLAGIALVVGIVWAGAFASLTVGSLNVMTSMFAVILLGLGVDFSIHLISAYTECRAGAGSLAEALEAALARSGGGVVVGAVTTAAAFLTLTVSRSAGMREFGIVAGSGVLFSMLAALVVLPALLSLRDRLLSRRARGSTPRAPSFAFLGHLAAAIHGRWAAVLAALVVLTAALGWYGSGIGFDYNYLNMEPVGLTSVALQHRVEAEFEVTPDFVLVTAGSVEEARRLTAQAEDLRMVGLVTSISQYLPSAEEQARRAPLIAAIRDTLLAAGPPAPVAAGDLDSVASELGRLEDNVIELAQLAYLGGQRRVDARCRQLVGDLDAPGRHSVLVDLIAELRARPATAAAGLDRFWSAFAPAFRSLALEMARPDPIALADLPPEIVDRFANRDRSRFLVTIYPKQGVWEDLAFLERFTRRMQQIDPRVTGIPSVFYVLIDIIGADGRRAAALTLAVVFGLLLLDLRDLRAALMALAPLIASAVWMVGIMRLGGLQLTLLNVIGVPLILGIGVDDGVHLLHRYRLEGPGRIEAVFSGTGKAVLLTSLTTMLAFGSLVFATYRGLGSMGLALFIGVGTCLVASVTVLPCLIAGLEQGKANAP